MNFLRPLHIASPGNLPLWSLAVEEQFYLLWPIAVYFLSRRKLIWCASGLMLSAAVLRGACTTMFSDHFAIYMLLPFRMDTLAAGALLALLWPSVRERAGASRTLRNTIAAAFVALSIFAFAGLILMSKHGISTDANTWIGNTFIYEGTLALSVSAMAISPLGFGRAFLSSWPLVWLGRISYSIYLIHLTTFRFIPRHRTIGTAAVAAAASIGYALLMWFAVEKPLLSKPESDHSSTATVGFLPLIAAKRIHRTASDRC